MIRKEIKTDGTFGGNYPDDIEYSNLPANLIEISEEQRDYIDSHLDSLIYDSKQKGIYDSPKGIVDISNTQAYKDLEIQKRKDTFYRQFIKTSLGCIRLKTAIGDFISILPNYSFEVMTTTKLPAGRILFYNEPDFTDENAELTTKASLEMTQAQYMAFYNEVQTEYQKLFSAK